MPPAVLRVCYSAPGSAEQGRRWVGEGMDGRLAGCVSDQVLPVTQCGHRPSLSPDVLRLEGWLIIQDRTIAWFE